MMLASVDSQVVAALAAAALGADADGTCGKSTSAFFAAVPEVRYEGQQSKNPYAFRFYDKDEVVHGKPMKEW